VLTETIAATLGANLLLDCPVTSVRQRDGQAEVTWIQHGKPSMATCRQVVVATPPSMARTLIEGLSDDVNLALGAMRYGPYVVGSLLTAERSAMPWDDIYAMVTPGRSFNMFFNTASLLRGQGPRLPGGSLMVYGAADLGRRLQDRSDDEVIATFMADLGDVFPELPAVIEETHVQRWPEGIPYSVPGRHHYQGVLEQPVGAIHFAGDYLGARGGMDTAADTGAEAAARILAALS
jgi:protoporphyrinogen/coproporphyrinogen III oxidase